MSKLDIDPKIFWISASYAEKLHREHGLSFIDAIEAGHEYVKALSAEDIDVEFAQGLLENKYDELGYEAMQLTEHIEKQE